MNPFPCKCINFSSESVKLLDNKCILRKLYVAVIFYKTTSAIFLRRLDESLFFEKAQGTKMHLTALGEGTDEKHCFNYLDF